MPSFYDPARRRELRDRLSRLAPGTTPRWGRMTASRMVLHLIESLRMAEGEVRARRVPVPLRPLARWLLIHHLPWPKGARTAPELLAGIPTTWEADLERLRTMVARHPEPAEGASLPEHPLFGRMRKHDWGTLLYRHFDHHLTQFGV